MIAKLSGILADSSFDSCVVDVHGVGYEVSVPLSTFDKLPLPGNPVELWIHTMVREDAITLFGFITAEERKLFRLLITVSGIGGKLALNILGAMPAANFCTAVCSGDLKALSRINGVGKRTAERLVVELRDKLATGFGISGAEVAAPAGNAANDAAMALEQLGFKRDAINKVLNQLTAEIPAAEQTSEKLLRMAIMRLNVQG